ncbi:MAG: hypothetical protein II603_10885, partial [Muribaculaceae bacterium]|nr:hypothetical protein [Muribaculaceae bacterium]
GRKAWLASAKDGVQILDLDTHILRRETALDGLHILSILLGILQEIIYLISTNLAINIRKLNIGADGGVFHCELDVFINDSEVVTKLCKRLKKVKGVSQAVRIA